MKNIKVIAVRYYESRIIDMHDFDSIGSALGWVAEENHGNLMVGYSPEWSVYIVEGSSWYLMNSLDHAGVRYDFIEFLEREHGGSLGNYHAENFRAMGREDF